MGPYRFPQDAEPEMSMEELKALLAAVDLDEVTAAVERASWPAWITWIETPGPDQDA